MKRFLLPFVGILALCAIGCNQDKGEMVSDADAAKLREKQLANTEKQITDIQNNPNMPADVKERAIGNIRAGAARASAGVQAGQAQGSKK